MLHVIALLQVVYNTASFFQQYTVFSGFQDHVSNIAVQYLWLMIFFL